MKMLGSIQIANQRLTRYANDADFCRIFREDINRLYLLSFLLTGNHLMAENCFVRGLEDVGKGNPVFQEWARSWARRTIIRKAIEMMQPRPGNATSSSAPEGSAIHVPAAPAEIAVVGGLPVFERFAFVMSVLERISDQECSVLLECSRGEVVAARLLALQRIAEAAGSYREAAGIARDKHARRGTPAHQLEVVTPLPASA